MIRIDCPPTKGEVTRNKIKEAALQLFAQRGIEAVSVRDINKAADQRNAGSINYHFSSRDDLIREIMDDVGRILDDDHVRRIAELEKMGGPNSIREVAEILILPTISGGSDQTACKHSLRFLQMAMMSHRDMLMEAMEGNCPGLDRCMDHVRRLAPEMPGDILETRIKMGMKFLLMCGSMHEHAQHFGDAHDPFWNAPWALQNMADVFVGIVSAPVSEHAMALAEDAYLETSAAV